MTALKTIPPLLFLGSGEWNQKTLDLIKDSSYLMINTKRVKS